jgi:hypothetical protein
VSESRRLHQPSLMIPAKVARRLGGAWCLAYLVEIIRYTAAVYGYFGAT